MYSSVNLSPYISVRIKSPQYKSTGDFICLDQDGCIHLLISSESKKNEISFRYTILNLFLMKELPSVQEDGGRLLPGRGRWGGRGGQDSRRGTHMFSMLFYKLEQIYKTFLHPLTSFERLNYYLNLAMSSRARDACLVTFTYNVRSTKPFSLKGKGMPACPCFALPIGQK